MIAQDAERLGRALGENVAMNILLPNWPDDTPVEDYGSLWNEWIEGLCDQIRVTLIRRQK